VPSDYAITSAIVGLARSLGLDTFGEGVETAVHPATLIQLGCGNARATYYSPAVSAHLPATLVALTAAARQTRSAASRTPSVQPCPAIPNQMISMRAAGPSAHASPPRSTTKESAPLAAADGTPKPSSPLSAENSPTAVGRADPSRYQPGPSRERALRVR
jgi:EAL domain-containing protein (putative c-di-GMP-specific phosphodiesterase class I)